MRVGARFGEPCFYPFVTGMDGYPHIFEVVKAENEETNFGGNWHSDTTYLEQPPLATLLYAVETPSRGGDTDRKSTRLNSSHLVISYAVFCLKKKKNTKVQKILIT